MIDSPFCSSAPEVATVPATVEKEATDHNVQSAQSLELQGYVILLVTHGLCTTLQASWQSSSPSCS